MAASLHSTRFANSHHDHPAYDETARIEANVRVTKNVQIHALPPGEALPPTKATAEVIVAIEKQSEAWIRERSAQLRSGRKLSKKLVFGDRCHGGPRMHGREDPNSPISIIEQYGQ